MRGVRQATARGSWMAAAAVCIAVVISGCAGVAPQPVPTPTRTATATPTPTPTPDPQFVEGGSASQNLPFFEFIIRGLLERSARPDSATIRDSLAISGFDLATIEITPDTTRVGQLTDSILVGIPIKGQCLLGQVINGELVSQLADVLGTGRCLVGLTASLD